MNALPLIKILTIRRAKQYTMSAIIRHGFQTQYCFTVKAYRNRKYENFSRAMPRKAQQIVLPAYAYTESFISLCKGGKTLFVDYIAAPNP